MKYIADLHIHSHFSIATSGKLRPEYLDYWGKVKGIQVVGTGDFTHPGWTKELKEKLRPAEPGFYRLKEGIRIPEDERFFQKEAEDVRFILTAEISNIYKQGGKTRKVHNVLFAPDFETVDKIQQKLSSHKFNITSDGRPILGLDSRDLLEMCLEVSPDIFFVPAHIWTPWFSAMGAKSGFDSIDACYRDLSPHIHAIETGLSSDPPMNWLCSSLDRFTIISNSDAHSPEKLGREANLFNTELSYSALTSALKTGDPTRFLGTLEFFPEEGKYHHDGHRKCGISWDPHETVKHDTLCPVCGKPVTVGVMHRVMQVADREKGEDRERRWPFQSIVPLREILGEIHGAGPNSKQVMREYHHILNKLGSELPIILDVPLEEIQNAGGELIAEAIRRIRSKEVYIQPGYDGEYGIIKAFRPNEIKQRKQVSLFKEEMPVSQKKRASSSKKIKAIQILEAAVPQMVATPNPLQEMAIRHGRGPAMVVAGPGTGKTSTLTRRIAYLIQSGVPASSILALTFTNLAAREMRERLEKLIEDPQTVRSLTIQTFHAFGWSVLQTHGHLLGRSGSSALVGEEEKAFILENLGIEKREIKKAASQIRLIKQQGGVISQHEDEMASLFNRYESRLQDLNAWDLDDLLQKTAVLWENHPDVLQIYQKRFCHVLVDEFQDVNAIQIRLIRLLKPEADSDLFVIGDPDQAIYGFRGADASFIDQIQNDYPTISVYQLRESYRCTNTILRASGDVLGKDSESALAGLEKGISIQISKHPTDKSEAEFVARTIESMMGGLRFFSMDSDISTGEDSEHSLSDFAVLARTGHQFDAIIKAFGDHSIPCQVVGETPFYEAEPVKTVLDILRAAIHPDDLMASMLIEQKILTQLDLQQLSSEISQKEISRQIYLIHDFLKSSGRETDDPGIERLVAMASSYGSDTGAFLRDLALGSNADTYSPKIEAVSLMTLHASKGLEFACVFITGCEDGLLPYTLYHSNSDRDEEKRLLYVGMTRAKRSLFLTHADKRTIRNRPFELVRSPFLDAIEKSLIELHQPKMKKISPKDRQMGLF